jgi:SRSO17 transposase
LIIDETGFLKKGNQSAGVARQYSGTAGRVENSQIGVFLAYRGANQHLLIDRELYIPQAWFKDKERCKKVRIPDNLVFKTKPELAQHTLARAFAHGIKPAWVVADQVYGWESWLLLRRSIKDPEKVSYYIAFGRKRTTLGELAKAAGSRWIIETCFQTSKGEIGLDHYQLRSYVGWYAHITLCLVGLLFLEKIREGINQVEEKKE